MLAKPAPPKRSFAPDEDDALLCPSIVEHIERALCRVGDFGEVRLIVVKGQLRFIQIVQSENVGETQR